VRGAETALLLPAQRHVEQPDQLGTAMKLISR